MDRVGHGGQKTTHTNTLSERFGLLPFVRYEVYKVLSMAFNWRVSTLNAGEGGWDGKGTWC